MSKLQLLNAFLTERLTVAAVEIFGAVEETIVDYQDEIYRSKEENKRLQKLLDLVLKPEIKLHRADFGQITISVSKDKVPHEQQHSKQDWSPGLGQEDPESTQITEEQEPGTKTPSYVESKDSPQHSYIAQIPPEEISTITVLIKSEPEEKSHAVSEPTRDSHLLSTVDLAGGPLLSASMLDRNRTLVTVNPECSAAQSKNVYRCHICNRCYKIKGRLILHLKLHTETPYHCNICKTSFKERGTLKVHMRTHKGERPYRCNVCEKHFKKNTHLIEHVRTHTEERPYRCNICEKCFKHKSRLAYHIRTHTGERPHSCHVCGKRFTQSSTMVVHIKARHKGESPYSCHFCGKQFMKKMNLTEHTRIHTGQSPSSYLSCLWKTVKTE